FRRRLFVGYFLRRESSLLVLRRVYRDRVADAQVGGFHFFESLIEFRLAVALQIERGGIVKLQRQALVLQLFQLALVVLEFRLLVLLRLARLRKGHTHAPAPAPRVRRTAARIRIASARISTRIPSAGVAARPADLRTRWNAHT